MNVSNTAAANTACHCPSLYVIIIHGNNTGFSFAFGANVNTNDLHSDLSSTSIEADPAILSDLRSL